MMWTSQCLVERGLEAWASLLMGSQTCVPRAKWVSFSEPQLSFSKMRELKQPLFFKWSAATS